MLYVWYPKMKMDLNIIHEKNDIIETPEELANVNAGINLTGYHPPPPPPPPHQADPQATNFFHQNPYPKTAFQCKTLAPGLKNRNENPTPRHNLPSSNAKRSMKRNIILEKQFLSKFSIIVHLTIFFFS